MLFCTQLWIITELISPEERQRNLRAAFCFILFSGYSALNGKISHSDIGSDLASFMASPLWGHFWHWTVRCDWSVHMCAHMCMWPNCNTGNSVFSNPHEYLLLFLNYSFKKVDFNLKTKTWLSNSPTGEFKEDHSLINGNMTTNKSTYIIIRATLIIVIIIQVLSTSHTCSTCLMLIN